MNLLGFRLRTLAQVTVHYRLKNKDGGTQHATECFECAPKQSRTKTYPVCTIRNTPDKPIHCIVWAKELLFARLFGRWVWRLLHACAFDRSQYRRHNLLQEGI